MEPPAASWQTHPTETARADAVVCNGPVDLLATVHRHGARFLWAVSATSRKNQEMSATWGGLSDDLAAAKLAAERVLYRWQRGILPCEPIRFYAVTITPEEVRDAMVSAMESGTIKPPQEGVEYDGVIRIQEIPASAWSEPIEPGARFGGWLITLFIEAGAIYHVYAAQAPDGRKFGFSPCDRDNPWNLLTPEQQREIHLALGGPAIDDHYYR